MEKTVQTMIHENPSSSTHLNYIANLKENFDKETNYED
jgi:hypothetical protein